MALCIKLWIYESGLRVFIVSKQMYSSMPTPNSSVKGLGQCFQSFKLSRPTTSRVKPMLFKYKLGTFHAARDWWLINTSHGKLTATIPIKIETYTQSLNIHQSIIIFVRICVCVYACVPPRYRARDSTWNALERELSWGGHMDWSFGNTGLGQGANPPDLSIQLNLATDQPSICRIWLVQYLGHHILSAT